MSKFKVQRPGKAGRPATVSASSYAAAANRYAERVGTGSFKVTSLESGRSKVVLATAA